MKLDRTASARSLRGLDWLNFFVANVQTGFGPFIAVYLASRSWTQGQIGFALSVGTLTAMVSQLPAGALVDALENKRLAALAASIAVAVSALIFAAVPETLPVLAAEVLHGFASCLLSPAIAAISLRLIGRGALGERLGRNARYAAIGSGVAAALLGATGSYVSEQAVFYLTAALMMPGLVALGAIRLPALAAPVRVEQRRVAVGQAIRLLRSRGVLVFAGAVVLFHLSNAAMLPLAAGEVTKRLGGGASLVIAACIVVPQAIVALLSPFVGRAADRWGRRPVLFMGFLALPLRGLLLGVVHAPGWLVAVQALDGLSAAAFGVMLPLVAADLTRGTNRFNLCLGALGLAAAGGATLSTTLAGVMADSFGQTATFLALAGVGLLSAFSILGMQETRLTPELRTA